MTGEHIVKWRTKVDWLYHSYAHPTEKHEKKMSTTQIYNF